MCKYSSYKDPILVANVTVPNQAVEGICSLLLVQNTVVLAASRVSCELTVYTVSYYISRRQDSEKAALEYEIKGYFRGQF